MSILGAVLDPFVHLHLTLHHDPSLWTDHHWRRNHVRQKGRQTHAQSHRVDVGACLSLAWSEYVGDSPDRITHTLKRAFESADVVFSCGGIGATPDDHTRQCAAQALGVPLQLHPEAKRLIQERMQDVAKEQGLPYEPDRDDNVHRLNMGMFPKGAQIIHNPYNKIPGFTCQATGQGMVHFVPGFPVMAWPMVEWVLDQRYATLFHREAEAEAAIIVFDLPESSVTPIMEQVESTYARLKSFSLPSMGEDERGRRVGGRHIELGVRGEPAEVALAIEQMKQAVVAIQGRWQLPAVSVGAASGAASAGGPPNEKAPV